MSIEIKFNVLDWNYKDEDIENVDSDQSDEQSNNTNKQFIIEMYGRTHDDKTRFIETKK